MFNAGSVLKALQISCGALRNVSSPQGHRLLVSGLCALLVTVPLLAMAEPPRLELSHRYLSFTPTDAGVSGVEYAFTITNGGSHDLYDLRIALGIGAPEPVDEYGQPTLRLDALAAGQTREVTYTVTMRETQQGVRGRELVGWVEAIEDHGGPIVSAGVLSRWAGEGR